MTQFGLIGYPLSHSFSKQYFTEKFQKEQLEDYTYELFPIETLAELPKLLQERPLLVGLNVTIPHKVSVLPFLTAIDNAAETIGAVNCIKIDRADGAIKLKGYNTDVIGFERSLLPLLLPGHTQALVFGNGGASKAVCYVLAKLQIAYKIITREEYVLIDQAMMEKHKLLINTTPLGMYPDIESYPPLNYNWLTSAHLVYDLVYNPETTAFLKKAANQGAITKNGLEMLVLQAEAAWEIWREKE